MNISPVRVNLRHVLNIFKDIPWEIDRELDISEIPFVSVSKTGSVLKTESVCRSIGIFQVPYKLRHTKNSQLEIKIYSNHPSCPLS
jgi:hypothetical protein